MPCTRPESLGVYLILTLLMLGVNPVAAEALPPLRIEPSLLGRGTASKPSAAVQSAEPTRSRPPAELAVIQKSPAAEPVAAQPFSATATPGHFVQIGAFSLRANADARLQQLAGELGALKAKLIVRQRGEMFLVQMGPLADATAARSVVRQLRERHRIESVYVVVGR